MTPSTSDHAVVNTVNTTHTLSDFDFELPETLIAVCRLAVLVSEPANMPVALSTLKPNQRAHSRAAPLPATTATAASRLARSPYRFATKTYMNR